MASDVLQWLTDGRAEFALAKLSMFAAAGLAGAAAVAQHPELADPWFRIIVVAFFTTLSLAGFNGARDSWLRLQGIDPIAADIGKFEQLNPWRAAAEDASIETKAQRAHDLLDDIHCQLDADADDLVEEKLNEAVGTAAALQVLDDRDEFETRQEVDN